MHDARGKVLRRGDVVMVPCVVVETQETDEFCNLSLKTQIGRRPDGTKEMFYAINSGVVIKVCADEE